VAAANIVVMASTAKCSMAIMGVSLSCNFRDGTPIANRYLFVINGVTGNGETRSRGGPDTLWPGVRDNQQRADYRQMRSSSFWAMSGAD